LTGAVTDNELAAIRARHLEQGLSPDDLVDDPVAQYDRWLGEAENAGVHQADAAVLATADADGRPSGRYVLILGQGRDELWFYTNRESVKGHQLAENPRAALIVGWIDIDRQAHFEGGVEPIEDEVSDAYWATRPRGSQLASRASRQSRRALDRSDLVARRDDEDARWEGMDVPRPSHWGGYRLHIEEAEFWQGRPDRLHDRFHYTRNHAGGWQIHRLDP
jgi:pyridoxamine 5'-phosphate oxidase